MLIPFERVGQDTLNNLVEEFITREGTDYGAYEMDLSHKVEHVMNQLASGEVVIVFDSATESVNLMSKQQYGQWSMESTV